MNYRNRNWMICQSHRSLVDAMNPKALLSGKQFFVVEFRTQYAQVIDGVSLLVHAREKTMSFQPSTRKRVCVMEYGIIHGIFSAYKKNFGCF